MIVTDHGYFAFFFSGLLHGLDFVQIESACPSHVGVGCHRVYDRCEFVRDLYRVYECGFGRHGANTIFSGITRHPALGPIEIERTLHADEKSSPFLSPLYTAWTLRTPTHDCTFLAAGWQPQPNLNTQVVTAGPRDRVPDMPRTPKATPPKAARRAVLTVGPRGVTATACPDPFTAASDDPFMAADDD